MPAFTFNLIGAPPADAVVNEQTQIGANLDQIENRMNFLQGLGGTWPDADKPPGLEAFINVSGSSRIAVWDTAFWQPPVNISANWTAWTALPLIAPYETAGVNAVPMWRRSSRLRCVQLRGRFRIGATGTPMDKTAWNNFSSGASGIPIAYAPLAGTSIWTASCSPITATSPAGSEIAAARIRATADATSVRLDFNWMGGDSGATNNYICVDGLEWWYL